MRNLPPNLVRAAVFFLFFSAVKSLLEGASSSRQILKIGYESANALAQNHMAGLGEFFAAGHFEDAISAEEGVMWRQTQNLPLWILPRNKAPEWLSSSMRNAIQSGTMYATTLATESQLLAMAIWVPLAGIQDELVSTLIHEARHAYHHQLKMDPRSLCYTTGSAARAPVYPVNLANLQEFIKAVKSGKRRVERFWELKSQVESGVKLSANDQRFFERYRSAMLAVPPAYSGLRPFKLELGGDFAEAELVNASLFGPVIVKRRETAAWYTVAPSDPHQSHLAGASHLEFALKAHCHDLNKEDVSAWALCAAELDAFLAEHVAPEMRSVFWKELDKLIRNYEQQCVNQQIDLSRFLPLLINFLCSLIATICVEKLAATFSARMN